MSTLGLGFSETSEISALPRLEQQGSSLDSDEQRVMKKAKNRDDGVEQAGGSLRTDSGLAVDNGGGGDMRMAGNEGGSGSKSLDHGPPEEENRQTRSYAVAVSGMFDSRENSQPIPYMNDVVVLDEDVIVDDNGPFMVI
ncbi:hypothetical protein V6N12_012707 [Hibiscus sabdariffa]|uniref:Uncharacterized protein n=1 Tax=Hibiscus sabdariffa TaxID=183260 RepID=A0ABR2DDD1_9ROSI